jgi:hypothetical protein
VPPAPLLAGLGEHLADRGPEPQGTVLLQPDLEVDPVDPAVDVAGPASDRLLNVVASSCQSLANLAIAAADRPWLVPRNYVNAGPESELDRPWRYSSGSTSATRGDLRAHAGRIAEANRFRSPVAGSVRLSLTAAPAPVPGPPP